MSIAAILIDKSLKDVFNEKKHFFDITIEKIKKFTDNIHVITLKPDDEIFDGFKTIDIKNSNEFLKYIKDVLDKKTVLILNAFSPLLDLSSTEKMLDSHLKNFFDFTYPDNLPQGLLPEIMESGITEFILRTIPENLPLFNVSVREIFERDIGSYDCNIFITGSRLIKYRLNFIPDSLNDMMVISEIIELFGNNLDINSLEDVVSKNPLLIRKRPTYYEIEINTERESGESYIAGRLNRTSEISSDNFEKILKDISLFSDSPMVSIGLFGEPFLHPEIENIINIISSYSHISFVLESRCLFLNTTSLENVLKLKNVKIIFDVSFSLPESFEKNKKPLNILLPSGSLQSIEEKINSLSAKERIYIQFTRTVINEKELYNFYEKWRDFSDRIIIKKPDTFGGELDKYRVVDLSPVKRFACLHLKHDIVILPDGTVPICREDYSCNNIMGNILSDGIANCWERMGEYYVSQWKDIFDKPPLCKGCDEWWVFNN